jgi:hypothetical protein
MNFERLKAFGTWLSDTLYWLLEPFAASNNATSTPAVDLAPVTWPDSTDQAVSHWKREVRLTGSSDPHMSTAFEFSDDFS